MMLVRLYLVKNDGTETETKNIRGFSFYKEAYMPYTTLSATFYSELTSFDIAEVRLYIGSALIHHGLADTIELAKEKGAVRVKLTSRGFTALLTENQLQPGMYTNISLNDLFGNYIRLPYVAHENNSVSSYVFVKRGTPLWDGAANLSYKITGKYPYIRYANTVMMSMPEDARDLRYNNDEVICSGSALDTRRMVSHFHMEDINGEYGSYEYTEPKAAEHNIIRHRNFELDRRFLFAPMGACEFRGAMSMRGYKRSYFRYCGYKGEDLNDIVTYGNIVRKRIKRLRITGNKQGVFTEVSVYSDGFTE